MLAFWLKRKVNCQVKSLAQVHDKILAWYQYLDSHISVHVHSCPGATRHWQFQTPAGPFAAPTDLQVAVLLKAVSTANLSLAL